MHFLCVGKLIFFPTAKEQRLPHTLPGQSFTDLMPGQRSARSRGSGDSGGSGDSRGQQGAAEDALMWLSQHRLGSKTCESWSQVNHRGSPPHRDPGKARWWPPCRRWWPRAGGGSVLASLRAEAMTGIPGTIHVHVAGVSLGAAVAVSRAVLARISERARRASASLNTIFLMS